MTYPNENSGASTAKDLARDTWENAADCTERTVEEGMEYVRSNPIPTLFAALAAGILIGLLIPRHEPSARKRYVDGPLDELTDLLRSLRDKAGGVAEEQYEGARSAIGGAIKKAKKRFHL